MPIYNRTIIYTLEPPNVLRIFLDFDLLPSKGCPQVEGAVALVLKYDFELPVRLHLQSELKMALKACYFWDTVVCRYIPFLGATRRAEG